MNYFKESELYYSYTAQKHSIDNTPSPEEMARLIHIRDLYLNPIRERFGSPIIITSGYRGKDLNTMVGGQRTSNHLFGEAVDLVPSNGNIDDLVKTIHTFLKETGLPFDEFIIERNKTSRWVHLAVRQRQGTPNRSKILRINLA